MITATEIAKILVSSTDSKASMDQAVSKVAEKYPTKLAAIVSALTRMRDLDDDHVTIVTATALPKAEKTQIEDALTKKFATNLSFEYTVDPTIIAGIIVKRGETIVDNTLAKRVSAVENKINTIKISQER